MVRAVDKADDNADAFQRSIISEAIYHFRPYSRPITIGQTEINCN